MTERELLDLIARARDEEWEELDLAGLDLEILPPEIGSLVKLKRLILGKFDREKFKAIGNKLTDLPKEIGNLKNLTILAAPHNRLNTIPESISQLNSLQQLDLGSNYTIETIPDFIQELTNLQKLDLCLNSVVVIPESIGQLINLQELNIYGNDINFITTAITQLVL